MCGMYEECGSKRCVHRTKRSLRAAASLRRAITFGTMRGEAVGTTATTNVGLHLLLDTSGLDVADSSVQIVAADGRPVSEVPLAIINGKAEINHPTGLIAGQYWVRLKKSGETMREYSLRMVER